MKNVAKWENIIKDGKHQISGLVLMMNILMKLLIVQELMKQKKILNMNIGYQTIILMQHLASV
jgi:hypothetical protein